MTLDLDATVTRHLWAASAAILRFDIPLHVDMRDTRHRQEKAMLRRRFRR